MSQTNLNITYLSLSFYFRIGICFLFLTLEAVVSAQFFISDSAVFPKEENTKVYMPDSISRKQIVENKTKIYVAEGAVTYNLMSVVPEKDIVYVNVDKGVESKTAKSKEQNIKSQQADKKQKDERPLPKQKTVEIRSSPEDDSLSRQVKRTTNLVLQNPVPKMSVGLIEINFFGIFLFPK